MEMLLYEVAIDAFIDSLNHSFIFSVRHTLSDVLSCTVPSVESSIK